MKIENQVCTKEQAERLVKLGIEYKKPVFWHRMNANKTAWVITSIQPAHALKNVFPAFTSAELGLMIPHWAHSSRIVMGTKGGYYASTFNEVDNEQYSNLHDTEASARAAVLINLLETLSDTGDITAAKLNFILNNA